MSKSEIPSSVALFTNDIDSFLGKREQAGPVNDLKNTQVRLRFSMFFFFLLIMNK